jgi:hypothetical protein
MRRYGYRHNHDEYTCPNCPELFVMQPNCIVYSGTCDSCSTAYAAKRNTDGTISVRTQLASDDESLNILRKEMDDIINQKHKDACDILNTPFGSYQKYTANLCSELYDATHDYVTGRSFETLAVGIEISDMAQFEEATPWYYATPEPPFTREPYKRRPLVTGGAIEADDMLEGFLKHYRGDYDG